MTQTNTDAAAGLVCVMRAGPTRRGGLAPPSEPARILCLSAAETVFHVTG
jgi:hypothetical protein